MWNVSQLNSMELNYMLVAFNREGFFPPWDIWQGLEIFLIVVTGEGGITGHVEGRPRDAAEYSTMYKMAPQQRIV